MEPTPRSLILDLLSTLGHASAPVRALVGAGGLFGMGENSVRVALTRLVAEGLVEHDTRGRYRAGPRAAAVNDQIHGWRRVEELLVAWSGGWVAVHLAGQSGGSRRERSQRGRALRLLGFRPLAPGLELRPDNLSGGVAGVREQLAALGLELPVFGVTDLDAQWRERALALWDGRDLVRGYRRTCRALEQSAARLRDLPRDRAMLESFTLGGAALRQIVLDPLLPDPIVPASERRALLAAMDRYDRLGREAWSGWLGEATPGGLPAGVGARGADAIGWRPTERS